MINALLVVSHMDPDRRTLRICFCFDRTEFGVLRTGKRLATYRLSLCLSLHHVLSINPFEYCTHESELFHDEWIRVNENEILVG